MVSADRKEIRIDGDIILGGLFPMHEKGVGGKMCGAIKEEKGIQRVEAMLFAVDQINADPKLLRQFNITLGVHILDTCLRDTYALEQSLEFIKAHMSTLDVTEYKCASGQTPIYSPKKPVAGVIGAAASPVSIMVANILRLFKIPQISYASTGIELSDKSRFGYFSRVVPPDTYQAQAMVNVVQAFGWSYVSTLADEGNYGERGIAAFETLADRAGICVAKSLKIPREVKPDTFKRLIKELLENQKAKVVILFASIDMEVTEIIHWLASDSWGSKAVPVNGQEWAAEGTITILPTRNVLTEFDDYFTKLTPENNSRNPWFDEFWESHFRGREYKQEGLVPFVVDSVYVMAHALKDLHDDKCGDTPGVCPDMLPLPGPDLLHRIRNTSFVGAAGHVVKFNDKGDATVRYTVYQYQKKSEKVFDYVPIGTWTDGLVVDKSLIRWKSGKQGPRSICSEPCPPGSVKKTEGLDSCCWVCLRCDHHEILEDESTCSQCPNGTFPDKTKSVCNPLPIQFLAMTSAWAIVPVVFAVCGMLTTLFVLLVFVRFDDTPVIMASGRELCYVMVAGLLLSYVMTFIMVAKPSLMSCTLLRIGLGLSMCICYSAILTKTNRISRIFNRGVKAMVKRPSYTSPRSQLVICACLVSVQVFGAITWVIMDPPGVTHTYPDRKTVVLRCRSNNVAVVLSLLYNMVLIIMCTVYAFKTRKIPENFNEAKYIAFTMYSTCIVWLAFVPIYFGTKNDFKIQIMALCMCISISATVQLGCLFVPKVYIVLFQPHKNANAFCHRLH
ncbi:hypothetical protein CAPTEDRAFT_198326 [Capitella teleta]|uniref:G-protein coupled receptors family 3 profile domain-containing protein n=1 Tax=Capitella teleta TaxID=283909 RepID=R7UAX3_CAPTE|nr:hypothetical protein CAPTEDRAFT_198326 [Capitella teleta]|eukprot:ELU03139.1 hypothetical protein CAPTEDRAFT_198326 [Capitella teleta]